MQFLSHHLRAGRAESTTTLEPELWVQRCELRVTVSQRTGDDNILCSVFCAISWFCRAGYSCSTRCFFASAGWIRKVFPPVETGLPHLLCTGVHSAGDAAKARLY